MTTATAPATAPPEGATNAELIRWAFSILNTHDVTPLRPMWTSTTIERFPTETCVGTDPIADYFQAAFDAVPDFHMEIQGIVESGDDVMVRWHLTGTHSGAAWQGIAPTGKRFSLDGIDHFVLRDGKVVSNFVVFDQMQFARQIGLLPPDGSPADRAVKAGFGAMTRLRARRQR
jgi:predicted ester cyclase